MNRRDLILFFILQILAIVWAGTVFSILQAKLAGGLAGGYFVVSGLFMLSRARRWPKRWSSLTWYCLMLHVFAISLPMLIARFLQIDAEFSEVRVMGIPGPVFHNISSTVFSILMLATVVDWIRATWLGSPSVTRE